MDMVNLLFSYPNQWPGDGEDNNLTNNATDLAELIIKRLDLGPAHLIGHSYGALTAIYMAYRGMLEFLSIYS